MTTLTLRPTRLPVRFRGRLRWNRATITVRVRVRATRRRRRAVRVSRESYDRRTAAMERRNDLNMATLTLLVVLIDRVWR